MICRIGVLVEAVVRLLFFFLILSNEQNHDNEVEGFDENTG